MGFLGNDLAFSLSGDLQLGDAGDIFDTVGADRLDPLASVKQLIMTRLVAAKNDWAEYPYLCAGLEQFIGSVISQEMLRAVENRIRQVLTVDGFISVNDLAVTAIDIGAGSEAIAVVIFLKNRSNFPLITFAYDFQRGGFTQVK